MNGSFPWSSQLAWLWQASWQSGLILSWGLLLASRVTQASRRAKLLHATVMLAALGPLLAVLTPHYILLQQPLPPAVPLVDAADSTMVEAPPSVARAMMGVLVAVWLVGVAWHAIRILSGWLAVMRLLRMTTALRSERIDALLRSMGSPATLRVRALANLTSPFCWQVQSPVLVLPPSVLDRCDEDLRLLLRHEVSHLRSGDPLKGFLEHWVMAVFWFHPLFAYVARRAQCWREMACDDWALQDAGSPRRLAGLLTDMAEQAVSPAQHAWRLSARGRPGDLRVRILRLVADRVPDKSIPVTGLVLTAGLLAGAAAVAVLRLAGPHAQLQAGSWTHWPQVTSRLLDAVGVQVLDFDLLRVWHDPRELRPEHRAAHRKWEPDAHGETDRN